MDIKYVLKRLITSKKIYSIGLLGAGVIVSGIIIARADSGSGSMQNGDDLIAYGKAWTNGNIKQSIEGKCTLISIGGNNGTPSIPALEISSSQAINGYGPGNYILTSSEYLGGNGVNIPYSDAVLNTYNFTIKDITHPGASPTDNYYAGSDVYELSGYYSMSNPYSNPFYYASGQYVHLTPIPKPAINIVGARDTTSGTPLN